jgi:hypothetical protein
MRLDRRAINHSSVIFDKSFDLLFSPVTKNAAEQRGCAVVATAV